jgi:hypothetical protein
MENISLINLDNAIADNQTLDCECFGDVWLQDNNLQNYSLASCVKYFFLNSNNELCLNYELSNKLTAKITFELAKAIDKNSVLEIKYLKQKYINTKEFLWAKNYLDKKCKEVWCVFEKNISQIKVPKEAMKALGITNQPPLDFLLADSLNYFEKDNGSTTVDIISSILKNEKINYSFNDIYLYLIKNKTHYNMKTLSYLCEKLEYNQQKLTPLGISKQDVMSVWNNLPLKNKIKSLIKVYLLQFCK